MNDPIKIIWKYKNSNRRIQYNVYIFIGDIISKQIMKILDKITELNLYDTLITLDKSEHTLMEEMYGQYWYTKFFNKYHIDYTISLIRESTIQQDELIDKFGQQWYDEHIITKEIMTGKLIYSFETIIKNELMRKTIKKQRSFEGIDDDLETDFTINKKEKKITYSTQKIRGTEGEMSDELSDESSNETQIGGNNDEIENDLDDITDIGDVDDNYEQTDIVDLINDENEFDLNEIENLYKESDIEYDKNISKTSELIKRALNDDKIFEKSMKKMAEFNTSKDTDVYDDNLKDVFYKNYVKNQYIFKDDTIKDIRNKICCGIKMNDKFDNELYLIPYRQYFWSEYYFNNEINKIMIGQKWFRRNELLNIDIEPLSNIRIYEELREPLKLLRDNIRRYNNKIRREDDENDILYDYGNYITNNELYMIDIYNELGLGYNPDNETIRNLQDIYLRIYYPRLRPDDFKMIIEFLNGNKKSEIDKSLSIFGTINNDLIISNEIVDTVEEVKIKDKNKYTKLFKDNYITQSVINLNLKLTDDTKKLDLFRIFNEFETNDIYPFVQYQTIDSNITYKFNEDKINEYAQDLNNKDMITKWFETAPYGVSFKMKVLDKTGLKFMSIVIHDNFRLEYKTQWKETDMATIDDVNNTYEYIRDLIKKINSENKRFKFSIPDNGEFKFAFINSIQKFELPNDSIINHNDLSNFSRYFYPYISLVIAPRKRQAKIPKIDEKSKFGTYLRYKRVSKYENQARIEQRIMYFIRNYEFTEKEIVNEISKQFNMTEEKGLEEYNKVKTKYPNLKKSHKTLKKLEKLPKYKPPGIGVDIQGKQVEKYKIRISGARSEEQLKRIITFMNILLYLYVETYLLKIENRQILKKKLESLKNIAERRQKVDEVVNYLKETKNVKQMAQIDKLRIGFKPEKGQNQWTRSCQNSGTDKKRRPQQYNSLNIGELIKKGYKLNKKTGSYEKKIQVKENGKKKDVVLRTIRLDEYDEEGNPTGNDIHYNCSPTENGEHIYVNFLLRSNNPTGHCMPCCFKKDPLESKNTKKIEYYKYCLGEKVNEKHQTTQNTSGDILYILQDTNKIHNGRLGYLPKYLDIYFNYALNKEKDIKHHYLIKSTTGYFFKYGSINDNYTFINTFCTIYDLDPPALKKKIISALEKDTNEQIFISLNNGDIKTKFGTKKEYIKYIKSNNDLDFNLINNILSLPNVITKNGVNIIVFDKKTTIIKHELEKEKIREDFVLKCRNLEDIDNLISEKDCIFMISDDDNYYSIVMTIKLDEDTKDVNLIKVFKYENKNDNIVKHVNSFYEQNCRETVINMLSNDRHVLTSRLTRYYLSKLKSEYNVKYQYIDTRNKCKYLITNNKTIIPVRPSGSLYDIEIVDSINKFITDYDTTFNNLIKIYKLSDKRITVKPVGVYYEDKQKNKILVNSILTNEQGVIPVIPIELDIKKLEENKLIYEKKPLIDKIDDELMKDKQNIIIDNRILTVNNDKYKNESYELFRLEFSEYINKHSKLKKYLENLIIKNNQSRLIRLRQIKLFIYKIINKNLYTTYKTVTNINDTTNPAIHDKLIEIINQMPDIVNYKIKNDRYLCKNNRTKDTCTKNPHCYHTQSGCYLSMTREMAIIFVNKISEELIQNDLKSYEIMRTEGYFVSDIVDTNRYTERKGERIIKGSNFNIKSITDKFFSKDKIIVDNNINDKKPMIDFKLYYLQKIIENNMTLLRAYSNGYYWLLDQYSDDESRNLGYYSSTQTTLVNYFRNNIINTLTNNKNIISDKVKQLIDFNKKDFIENFCIKIMRDTQTISNGVLELHILSIVNEIPIIVHDNYDNIIYIYNNGLVYNSKTDTKIPIEYSGLENSRNAIHIKYTYGTGNIIPDKIDVIYYK